MATTVAEHTIQPDAGPSTSLPAQNGEYAVSSGPNVPKAVKRKLNPHDPSLEPMSEVLLRRITTIKEGDNVLLRLPSDSIKSVIATKDGLLSLGKYAGFPASLLLGLQYDITYEVYADSSKKLSFPPMSDAANGRSHGGGEASTGKKGRPEAPAWKGKGKERKQGEPRSNPGWSNLLRPLKRQEMVDAIIEDITETNEFIDDSEAIQKTLLSQEEIAELRAQGVSGEAMIKAQLERHDQFALKTDFSKEKWRKRKEKKYLQTVHPISPSAYNITNHYFTRSPQTILNLRADTLSQLLTLANIRPGGRYLIVDDTGGLVTAAMMERMGCDGRILILTDADSPPDWGVLNVMNFGERELGCVKWLSWMEAEERYERPLPPDEGDMLKISETKTSARWKRFKVQAAELNETRDELHIGNWDGIILATELNPVSCLARLTPYLGGSGLVTVYSPHLQILAETLKYCKHQPCFLNANMTESLTRTYQVLPGRTHPLMTTSATGGYLMQVTKVYVGRFEPDANQNKKRKDQRAAQAQRKRALAAEASKANGTGGSEELQADAAGGEGVEDEEIVAAAGWVEDDEVEIKDDEI